MPNRHSKNYASSEIVSNHPTIPDPSDNTETSTSIDDPASGGFTDTGALTYTALTDTTATKCRLPSHEAVS